MDECFCVQALEQDFTCDNNDVFVISLLQGVNPERNFCSVVEELQQRRKQKLFSLVSIKIFFLRWKKALRSKLLFTFYHTFFFTKERFHLKIYFSLQLETCSARFCRKSFFSRLISCYAKKILFNFKRSWNEAIAYISKIAHIFEFVYNRLQWNFHSRIIENFILLHFFSFCFLTSIIVFSVTSSYL